MGWWIYTFATCTYFLHLCFISWLKLCSIGGILKGKALCFPCFVLISSIFFACGAKKKNISSCLALLLFPPQAKMDHRIPNSKLFLLKFFFLGKTTHWVFCFAFWVPLAEEAQNSDTSNSFSSICMTHFDRFWQIWDSCSPKDEGLKWGSGPN